MNKYYLIGIGGSGMSALAQILVHEGHQVSGSDRDTDSFMINRLKRIGIKIYRQDGSSINKSLDRVIISRAIEDDNPDLIKVKNLKIPIVYRQDILKELFRTKPGIAVAGTSGKTTVVGLIGCMLDGIGEDITIINGGIMKNYSNNVKLGKLAYYCIETDESEGSLKGYYPEIGVLTNIGYDHRSRAELIKIYKDFVNEVKNTLVINSDFNLRVFSKLKKITYNIKGKADIRPQDIEIYPNCSLFKVDGCKMRLQVPGIHNISNALAAIGVARAMGVATKDAISALEGFEGIKRRFEIVGETHSIRVIDDFAHNPDKIRASLETAKFGSGRVIIVFQPHGYTPTRMFFDEFVNIFADTVRENDILFMPEIYYAGGTAVKDVSSKDLVDAIRKRNNKLKVKYFPGRDNIVDEIKSIIQPNDTILIMGARDNSLCEFANQILKELSQIVSVKQATDEHGSNS